MYIAKDIDEISACIVCPCCKQKSPKDWYTWEIENKDKNKSMLKRNMVYFRCIFCNHCAKVFDNKLALHIYNIIRTKSDHDNSIIK